MFIDESFLSFIWRFTYFRSFPLQTTRQEELLIRFPGRLNPHAGPDFLDARIRIGGIQWIGAVEIHMRSSDWTSHGHSENPDYDRVVLHVVWQHNSEVYRSDGSLIPTLELQSKVSQEVVERYTRFMYDASSYPCHSYFNGRYADAFYGMIEKTAKERLLRKADLVTDIYREVGLDWEETAYRMLARNFGFKVNQDNMYLLARSLPYRILIRHRDNVMQLEALLFGVAGFLDRPCDAYSLQLYTEYNFLRHKYALQSTFLRRYQWRFLRLRPQNFPTIRLAQFAMLLHHTDRLFSSIMDSSPVETIINALKTRQSDYWLTHYDFGKSCRTKLSGLGGTSIQNILINSIVPILSAYSGHISDPGYLSRAGTLLQALPAENNRIVRRWLKLGLRPAHALDTQAIIELSNTYCSKKKCLNCSIGTQILMEHNSG